MKTSKTVKTLTEELIANAVGWLAGLLSVDLLSHFFAVRSWKNAWGLFSRKATVSAETFSVLEWVVTAVIGFAVLIVVNRYVGNWLLSKFNTQQTAQTPENPTQAQQTDREP